VICKSVASFDFDLTVTLADVQTGLAPGCRAIDDVSILDSKFGSVPRTHDGSALERTFRPRQASAIRELR